MNKITLFIILLIIGLFGSSSAYALQISYPDWLPIREGMLLTEIVSVLFNFLLFMAGIVAFAVIVWGGFNYLTSAGNPTKMSEAQKQVFAAILGLIILFSSWLILNTINPDLVNIREPAEMESPSPSSELEPLPVLPEETPAGFYDIPFGKITDELIIQEEEALPKMREFANLAAQCGIDYCDGGECEYEIEVYDSGCDIDPVSGKEDCWEDYWTETETCSAPCNTEDCCPADKDEVMERVLTASDEMEEEMNRLLQGKQQIVNCVAGEDTILLSCQEVVDIYQPENKEEFSQEWEKVKTCRQGRNFYCFYGASGSEWLEEIVFPLETPKESIEAVKELESIVSSCDCSEASFSCEECSEPCSGTPCPHKTYSTAEDVMVVIDELENQINKIEETIAELIGLSMADEITTLTCSEAYSWLKLIKESGCPGVKVFPCCPIDQETEQKIKSCRATDFFFCIAS